MLAEDSLIRAHFAARRDNLAPSSACESQPPAVLPASHLPARQSTSSGGNTSVNFVTVRPMIVSASRRPNNVHQEPTTYPRDLRIWTSRYGRTLLETAFVFTQFTPEDFPLNLLFLCPSPRSRSRYGPALAFTSVYGCRCCSLRVPRDIGTLSFHLASSCPSCSLSLLFLKVQSILQRQQRGSCWRSGRRFCRPWQCPSRSRRASWRCPKSRIFHKG